MPNMSPTLWFYSGQAIRQGLPDIEGAAPRKAMAKTPAAEPIRLAIVRVDEMKPGEVKHYKLNVGRNRSASEALDMMLMREVLEAFDGLLQHTWANADVHPRCGYGTCDRCDKAWDVSIAVIAKLEQRLLRE